MDNFFEYLEVPAGKQVKMVVYKLKDGVLDGIESKPLDADMENFPSILGAG